MSLDSSASHKNTSSSQSDYLDNEPLLKVKADFDLLAYAYQKPELTGLLKTYPEDFRVNEISNTVFTEEGEHLWCWVEKRGQNTDWVAGMLAKWANTSKHNVGFAGQKDRQAITKQWFSIQLPGKANPDPATLDIEGVSILEMHRHNKKLQRGDLIGNQFTLVLRDVCCRNESLSKADLIESLDKKLSLIQKNGVPNYFGEQRFGRDGNNLVQGAKLLLGGQQRHSRSRKRGAKNKNGNQNQQGLYISALRSWMFNELLNERIKQGSWHNIQLGDLLKDLDSHEFILVETEEVLDESQQKLQQGTLELTGGLFGDGPLPTAYKPRELEETVVKNYQAWCDGLSQNRVKPDRRSLGLMPQNLTWSFEEITNGDLDNKTGLNLILQFALPAGSFATMVLREILQVSG